jgi:hypothetical protein
MVLRVEHADAATSTVTFSKHCVTMTLRTPTTTLPLCISLEHDIDADKCKADFSAFNVVLVMRKATHGQQWAKGYTLIDLQMPSRDAVQRDASSADATVSAAAASLSPVQQLTAHDGRTYVIHFPLPPLASFTIPPPFVAVTT